MATARFGELFDKPTPLEEIAFNATDFRAGLPFRFLKSVNARARIGNGRNSMPREVAKRARVADIVAASSCFPGGFEPIGFPDDFVWEDPAAVVADLTAERGETFRQPIPLMDGGVADNQGLGSLRDSIERLRKHDGRVAGLVLISDADQAGDRPLLEHTRRPNPRGARVADVFVFARVLFCLALIAAVLLGWRMVQMVLTRQLGSWLHTVETVCAFLVSATAAAGWLWAWRLVRRLQAGGAAQTAGLDVRGIAARMSVAGLVDLLRMRVESLSVMAGNVFMKNIRDLRTGSCSPTRSTAVAWWPT